MAAALKNFYHLRKETRTQEQDPEVAIDIEIEEDEDKSLTSHEGEEFMAVITGKVVIKYGTVEQILEAGDTVYYNSVVPHFVGAIGGPAEILAVLYVPN